MKIKHYIFCIVFLIKIFLLGIFSSGYSNNLFRPFVEHYIMNGDNPWRYFFHLQKTNYFPYPPLMLYIHSVFYSPIIIFGIKNIFIKNIFFKLPLLLSDFLLFISLIKLYPNNFRNVFIFYLISPIIIYSTYIHSQLDIIPTALLFFSLFLLIKKKYFISSIILGLSLATKIHIFACLPLFIIYLYKKKDYKYTLYYLFIPIIILLLFSIPYFFTREYINYVFFSKEQDLMIQVFFSIVDLKIYVTPLILIFIYFRFYNYRKINKNLFLSFLTLLFSVFVLIIPPSPAWYIWFFPFILIFIFNNSNPLNLQKLVFSLNFLYIIYFIFFYFHGYDNIIFLNNTINLNFSNNIYKNISYTLLTSNLLLIIYFTYREGIQSNSIYKIDKEAFVIGIGGDSGSGKTTLLNDIKSIFGNKITMIEGDGDHKWERGDINWNTFTHLDPKANYIHRQAEDIYNLKNYNKIIRNDYNHENGKFVQNLNYKPNDILILSGLHTFYLPRLRKLINLRIFLNTDNNLRKYWKIKRDTIERGYKIDEIIKNFNKRAEDSIKYILPQKKHANFIINYFSKTNIDFQNYNIIQIPLYSLVLEVDSSVNFENLITVFKILNINFNWDYSEDLETQIFKFENEPNEINYTFIVESIFSNIDEIVNNNILWEKGYRGLIQIFILFLISEYKKS